MATNRSQRHGILIVPYQRKSDEDEGTHNVVLTTTSTIPTNNDTDDDRCFRSSPTTFIPDDVMLQCFTYLTLFDLANVQSTSRHWNTIVNTNEKDNNSSWLWKHAYGLRFLCRVHTSNNNEQKKCKQPVKFTTTPNIQNDIQYDWKYHCKHRLTMMTGSCNPENFSTGCAFVRTKDTNDLIFENYSHGFTARQIRLSIMSRSIRSDKKLFEYAKGWSYFEATVWGEGSVGIVSISTDRDRQLYGDRSHHHLGWYGVSYGYHNDDGYIYASNEWSIRYRKLQYGPTWGSENVAHDIIIDGIQAVENDDASSVVGCGYNCSTNDLFFTLDGKFLGLVPFETHAGVTYAAGASLHNIGDRVQMNFGQLPFLFDIDQFCFKS